MAILNRVNCLARIMYLGFSRSHVISEVTSGMKNTNESGSKVRRIIWREIFVWSTKLWGDFLREVTLWRLLKSNPSGSFCKAWLKIRDTCFWEWKKLCGGKNCLPPIVRDLSMHQVKKSGLGIQNPVISAAEKYTSFLHAIYKPNGEVMGKRYFSTSDHPRVVKEEGRDKRKYWYNVNDAKLRVIINDQGAFEKHPFLRAK